MFRAIGQFSARNRWWVIGGWLALAVAAVFAMPSITDYSMSTGFLDPGVESVDARQLINEKFPEEGATVSTAVVVVHNPDGLTAQDESYAEGVAASVRSWDSQGNLVSVTSVFEQPELRPNLVSPDGTTLLIPVGVGTEGFDQRSADSVKAIRESLPVPPAGTSVLVAGDAGLGGDHIQACIDALTATAIVTLVLITIILLAVYRSPVAPLVPLATIGVSAIISLGALGLLMRTGLEFSSFLQEFLILIVFGAGTDYVLFMISRYREELAKGQSPHEAVAETMQRVGVVIASSALVVAAGFAVLAFAEFEMFRTIGPGIALAVVILLLVALTFTPAVMAALNPRVLFWPYRLPRAGAEPQGFWHGVGTLVGRSPAGVLVVGLVLLLGPISFIPWMNRTFELDNDLPTTYESVEGHKIVAQRFDQSELLPVNLVVQTDGDWRNPEALAKLASLSRRVDGIGDVASVRGPTRPMGQPLAVDAVLGTAEGQATLPYYVSADGTTARLMAGLGVGPYTNDAYDAVHDVRGEAASWADRNGGVQTLVGGPSAEVADLIGSLDGDTPRVLLLMSVAIFVILALLLRSVVAPVYILASIYGTVLATLAVTALVFQVLLDFRYDGVDWVVPLMLFILLIVLAADYSIFLMSRIKEEAESEGLHAGVVQGVRHTGGVISACGLILAGTFAALVATPLGSLIQMGFAIAFGVLLDTFVVRPIILPAITQLLGRWAWWPGPLSRAAETIVPQLETVPHASRHGGTPADH